MASSKKAVIAALAGNSFLTAIKFVAFGMTGSGSMFSEAMHSLADTANQTLLLIGIRSSEREPDQLFHYGYGGDRYLFSLLSAVGIFVLGGGVTLYHAVHSLLHPEPLRFSWLPFIVLGISLLVDGFVLTTALKAINAARGEVPLGKYLRESDDPTAAAVLLEDGVACGGVLVAMIALALAYWTGDPRIDAIGGLIIAGALGAVAIWLGIKNRTLLLGPAAPKALTNEIHAYLEQQPEVRDVRSARSRIVGAEQVRLSAELQFDGAYLGRELTQWARDVVPQDKQGEEFEAFCAAFGDKLVESVATRVDRLEASLAKEFPELSDVDLEADRRSG